MDNPNFKEIVEGLNELSDFVKELAKKMDELMLEEEQEEGFNCKAPKNILELGSFTIEPNYSDWYCSKKNYQQDTEGELFYLEIDSRFATLTVEQAKKLKDYLNTRIEYLEGDN